jgi:hypothetical protein
MSLSILERQNNFLYFDADKGLVKITPQAMELPEVKMLFRRDKSMGKKFFQKNITFLYYSEHKDSPLSHKMEEIKVRDIKRIYDNLNDFDEKNSHYLELKKAFVESHYSMKELRYLKAMEDANAIINMAMDVPIQIKKKIELSKDIECFDEKGNPTTMTVYFKEELLIDNSTEKTKAISNIQSLNKLVEMLESQIKTEYRKESRNATRAMFDN